MNMRVGRWEAEQDFYAILGISRSATAAEVRRARRRLALKHHPDRAGAAPDDARMKLVNLGASVLLDPAARARYDAMRAPATWPTPPMPAPRPTPVAHRGPVRARPIVMPSYRGGASALSPWLFAAAFGVTMMVAGLARISGGPVPVASSEYRVPAGPQIASLWAD